MRHSWISYMIAKGHSKAEIAEWAGNSEAIIETDYRHPLMREDGDAWFSLPEERLNALVEVFQRAGAKDA